MSADVKQKSIAQVRSLRTMSNPSPYAQTSKAGSDAGGVNNDYL